MAEETKIYKINERYKCIFEKAASSTKQIDGFKVEANSDDADEAMRDAVKLYKEALIATTPIIVTTVTNE